MSSPLVTIALSVFNLESYVAEAIESVLQQSYQNWELIAIDDASTDKTFDVLKRYECSKIHVFRNELNRGTYWNRNLALLWAKGEFFTTIDGDDRFLPDKLKMQVEELGDRGSACFCYCIREHPRFRDGKRIYNSHNTIFFRRSLVEKIGYYDITRFGADTEYIRRISLTQTVSVVRHLLVKYRVREGSLTEQFSSGTAPDSRGAEIRLQYEQNYKAWYQENSKPYVHFPPIRRSFDAGCPSQAVTRDPIVVSLATSLERKTLLHQTIKSILPWADRINVFLNDYPETPSWLNQPKINVHRSNIDIGNRGKFWWAETTQGYHFICDDNILYSEESVHLLLLKIEYYHRKAIVGLQGGLINSPSNHDYNLNGDSLIDNTENQYKDREMEFLETGMIAYHTEKVHLSFDLVKENRMTNISLSRYAKEKNIPLICCESPCLSIKDVSSEQRQVCL